MNESEEINTILSQVVETFRFKNPDRLIKLDIQRIQYQISLFRYLNSEKNDNQIILSDFILNINNKVERFTSKFNPSILQLFNVWVSTMIFNPELFSQAVVEYFLKNFSELNYFGNIIFPSIFYHFLTVDFLEIGNNFLISLIRLNNIEIFIPFFSGYILSFNYFTTSITQQFHDNVIKYPFRTSKSDAYQFLKESLSNSIQYLPSKSNEIIDIFREIDSNSFIKCLFNDILIPIFKELSFKFLDLKIYQSLFQLLFYCSNKLDSPHSLNIFNLFNINFGSKWYPPHSSSSDELLSILILNCLDCFKIEKFIKETYLILKIEYLHKFTLPIKNNNQNRDLIYVDVALNKFKKSSICEGKIFYNNLIEKKLINPKKEINRIWLKILSISERFSINIIEIKNNINLPVEVQKYILSVNIPQSNEFNKYFQDLIHNQSFLNSNDLEFSFKRVFLNNYYKNLSNHHYDLFNNLLCYYCSSYFPNNKESNEILLDYKNNNSITSQNFIVQNLSKINNNEDDIENLKKTLTSEYFNPFSPKKIIDDQKNSIEKTSFITRPSTFEFLDDEQVIEVKSIRKLRRNSINEKGETNSIKQNISQLLSKISYFELKYFMIINYFDSLQIDCFKLDQNSKKYLNLLDVFRMKFLNVFIREYPFLINILKKISNKLNLLKLTKRGQSINDLLLIFSKFLILSEEFHKKYLIDNFKIFQFVLLLTINSSIFEPFIWLERMIYGINSFKEIIPKNLLPSLNYLQKNFPLFIQTELDPNFYNECTNLTRTLI